jgi:uncharacterized protein YbjT (DUF2867 family)
MLKINLPRHSPGVFAQRLKMPDIEEEKMHMKVIVAGGTGMVGSLVLQYCSELNEITEIISLVRRPSANYFHQKVKEIVLSDFEDYSQQASLFQHVDAAFFCIGVYTGQVPKEEFKKITVDYAVAFAGELKKNSPDATLCLLSGAGADRTEKSKTAFARYKGMAENQISNLGLSFYSFRPAYIYPVTPRKEPNVMYRISRALYPLFRALGPNYSIQSTELARAMVKVGFNGAEKEVLENQDILHQL